LCGCVCVCVCVCVRLCVLVCVLRARIWQDKLRKCVSFKAASTLPTSPHALPLPPSTPRTLAIGAISTHTCTTRSACPAPRPPATGTW
jgi:hypothetical protein